MSKERELIRDVVRSRIGVYRTGVELLCLGLITFGYDRVLPPLCQTKYDLYLLLDVMIAGALILLLKY